jgi:hypothetical protein
MSPRLRYNTSQHMEHHGKYCSQWVDGQDERLLHATLDASIAFTLTVDHMQAPMTSIMPFSHMRSLLMLTEELGALQ